MRRAPRIISAGFTARRRQATCQSTIGEIKPRFRHAGHLLYRVFDLRDAGTAANAIDRELHAGVPLPARLGIQRKIRVSVMAAFNLNVTQNAL